jgi:hypothetical protein
MIVRNRRGNRRAGMRTRIGVASAVLAGAVAIGVAVAVSSSPAPSVAQSAGYSLDFHHTVSEGTALSTALSEWSWSHQKAYTMLSEMAPVRSFSTASHGRTEFAMERGVVALATKHFLLVKSANGSLHLWLLNGQTHTANVANSTEGTAAMTGNTPATTAAMQQGDMAPAAQVMGGSTTTVNALNNPAPQPATFTVSIAGSSTTITVTITSSTATVAPTTTQAAQQMAQQAGTTLTRTTQPTFAATDHVARGDLVLVAGVKRHGFLFAQLVLFSAPGMTVTPTPMPTRTATATATPTVSPTTVAPNVTVSGMPAVNGTRS